MKTINITLYEYDELTPQAKTKALDEWNENNENPFMQSHMINLLKEELDERKIEYDMDSIDVRYSLSHSQGDGFMFEGKIVFEQYPITVKHSGHYYHSYSKTIVFNYEGEENDRTRPIHERVEKKFEEVYQAICKKMEQIGYNEIEYQMSEERFIEECDEGAYVFEANGTLRKN